MAAERHSALAQSHIVNEAAMPAATVQLRETGEVRSHDVPKGQVKALPFAKSWVHMMAGA
jgi:solute carrier family 25 protein 33/36